MATQIAEPNDIPSGSITDETANNYEILVYQKAQDNAGIKRMAIAGWKTYLNYDSGKTGRLASFIGVDPDYHWDDPTAGDYSGTKVTQRIQALSDKIGLNTEPAVVTETLLEKVETLQGEVETSSTGLLDRVTDIETTIGTPSGGSGTLTSRITALETTVDGTGGLVETVGDANSGLVKTVTDHGTDISTLQGDVTNIQTDVGNLQGDVGALQTDVGNLETTVGDASSGLVQQVNTNTTDIDNLKSAVGSAYKYIGNVTAVDNSSNTTAIYVDGTLTPLTDLNNSEVFNVNPTAPATDITMTINGVSRTYQKGANIAWSDTISDFDELGTAIDVTKLDHLEQQVNGLIPQVTALSNRFQTDTIQSGGSWSSTSYLNQKSGTYLFTSTESQGLGVAMCSFIIAVNTSGQSLMSTPIDLSANFSSYFSIDANNVLSAINVNAQRKISYVKIGNV